MSPGFRVWQPATARTDSAPRPCTDATANLSPPIAREGSSRGPSHIADHPPQGDAAVTIATTCPTCGRRVNVPETLAGRRIACPRCADAWRVPQAEAAEEAATAGPAAGEAEGRLALSLRLGIAAVVLGMLSVVVLCLPFV